MLNFECRSENQKLRIHNYSDSGLGTVFVGVLIDKNSSEFTPGFSKLEPCFLAIG